MKTFSIRAGLLVAAAMAILAVGSTAVLASHSWGNYHWGRTSNPFTLKVGDNVSTGWDGYLNTSVTDWSTSTVLDLTKVAGGTSPKTCRGTTGRVEVCNSNYGNVGWLGVAQIWISGDHITKGIVKLNDTYFNTATYNTPAWRNMVMCQEIGHTLGLDHQDENFNNANLGTCMDYTSDPSTNQHPNGHDYDQLVTIYSHLDSTTTLGSSVQSGPGKAGAAPGLGLDEHGLPAQASAANGDVYVTDLGNGQRLVTHILWIERGR